MQITVRNVSPELAKRLKRMALSRGESVNTTVVRLLEAALGVDARRARLERYATWSDADAAEFDEALRAQRTVDAKLWG